MTLFFGFIIAVFTTMALVPPLMRWASVLRIVDVPDARKVHQGVVPRIGGIAMVAGALVPLILWLPPEPYLIAYICGVLVILIFGVWDDRSNLDYRIKFFGQTIAVLVVVLYGGVLITHIPFLDEPLPYVFAFPLTVFVLLGITNAINLADGLDGLAGGTTLLSIGLLALLSYLADATDMLLINVAIMGCILGFLRFNTHPASVFMGDGGSQFLGFSAGVLAILLTQEISQSISPVLPILFLGLPILDTLTVMGQRIYEGRSPFSPDKNHIHHKLLALGLDHYEAVFMIYVIQAMLVSGAYLLRFQSDLLILVVYLFFCLSVIAFFRYTKNSHFKIRRAEMADTDFGFIRKKIEWLRQEKWLVRSAYYFALMGIPTYLFLMAIFADRVPVGSSIAVVSWIMVGVMCVFFLKRRNDSFHIIERAILYVSIVFVVYLVQVAPGRLSEFSLYRNVFFVLLAIAVAIGFRFSTPSRLKISTLDFLVIFLAASVPNLQDVFMADTHIGEGLAKVIVLFYGAELVLANMWRRWAIMRIAIMIPLAVLGVRGISM